MDREPATPDDGASADDDASADDCDASADETADADDYDADAIRAAADAEEATLCHAFRERDGCREVLLIEKQRGVGEGNVIGPGGKLEDGETPHEAVVREVREEVGLSVEPEKCGELAFTFGGDPFMFVHVYRSEQFDGTPRESPEAVPRWYPVEDLPYDEMWDDDRLWFPLMLDDRTFRGTFHFTDDGEEMLGWELDADVDL